MEVEKEEKGKQQQLAREGEKVGSSYIRWERKIRVGLREQSQRAAGEKLTGCKSKVKGLQEQS